MLWIKIILQKLYLSLFDKEYRKFAWIAFLYGNRKRFVTGPMNIAGKKFMVADSLSVVWQYYEIFYQRYYAFKTTNPSPRIIDIGSNVGLSLFYFHQNYPKARITGYEADPNIYKILSQNQSKHFPSVEVVHKAVWINNDGILLNSQGADGGSITENGDSSSIPVPSISFKDILEKEAEIDMLKMDIEGAENKVLIECSEHLHKVKQLFIEYHSFTNGTQKLGEILSILSKHNFTYYILDSKSILNSADQELNLQCNIVAIRS